MSENYNTVSIYEGTITLYNSDPASGRTKEFSISASSVTEAYEKAGVIADEFLSYLGKWKRRSINITKVISS